MALDSTFDVLLREYAPNDLLENTIKKYNYFINKVKKDAQWGLGAYRLPIELQENSRFEFGALPASDDIQGALYDNLEVSNPAELLGSMRFLQKDLERHSDLKKSFLQIAPGKIKQFSQRMNETASISMMGDGSLMHVTADCSNVGVCAVDRVWLLTADQKITIKETVNDTTAVTGYVKRGSIDINAGTFVLVTAPGGSTGVDCSGIDLANEPKVYVVGATTKRFTSLIDIVFPAALGGADTLYGGSLVKADSPVLQPFAKDISSASTAQELKEALFDWYYTAEEMGRSENSEVLVPYNVFKALAQSTELQRQLTSDSVSTVYGAKSMMLQGPDGDMKITGVRDMNKGYIVKMDWDAVVLASRGALIKNAKMSGDYFEERTAGSVGYSYIVDKKLEAELIVLAPAKLAGAKVATSFTV